MDCRNRMGIGPSSSASSTTPSSSSSATPSSSSSSSRPLYFWCNECKVIQHEEACFHLNQPKRVLKDVVYVKDATCIGCECTTKTPGWYIQYSCGHVIHLDICFQHDDTCPKKDGGTLTDPGNLSCNIRNVRKSSTVTMENVQQCGCSVAVAAKYLSDGGHFHLALHLPTAAIADKFQIFKNDVLFPTCYNGRDMSPGLHEYLAKELQLPCELPYGTEPEQSSPFEELCKEHTVGLYFGRRGPGVRRVYLCFGAKVAETVMRSLLEDVGRTAVVCFTGWNDFRRHLEIRPFRALTLPSFSPKITNFVSGILSVRPNA